MDARDYLSQAFKINRRVRWLEKQLKLMKSETVYTSPVYGDIKIQTNMTGSAVESAALRIVHLENQLQETREELQNAVADIRSTIKRVGDTSMEALLEMRYLSFMDWDDVIDCIGYSRSYVFKLHSAALRRVKTLI